MNDVAVVEPKKGRIKIMEINEKRWTISRSKIPNELADFHDFTSSPYSLSFHLSPLSAVHQISFTCLLFFYSLWNLFSLQHLFFIFCLSLSLAYSPSITLFSHISFLACGVSFHDNRLSLNNNNNNPYPSIPMYLISFQIWFSLKSCSCVCCLLLHIVRFSV